MKKYIYDNQEYDEIPAWLWEDTSPISERFFIEHGGRIEDRPDPEPETTHTYSKYKIKLACEDLNIWEEVKSYIEQAEKWESFLLITDISSDNDEFKSVLPTLAQAFGENTVQIVLEASEI